MAFATTANISHMIVYRGKFLVSSVKYYGAWEGSCKPDGNPEGMVKTYREDRRVVGIEDLAMAQGFVRMTHTGTGAYRSRELDRDMPLRVLAGVEVVDGLDVHAVRELQLRLCCVEQRHRMRLRRLLQLLACLLLGDGCCVLLLGLGDVLCAAGGEDRRDGDVREVTAESEGQAGQRAGGEGCSCFKSLW